MGDSGWSYGATSKHIRVGIRVVWDDIGPDTTSSRVWVQFSVESQGWGFADPQTLVFGGSLGGSYGYTGNSPSGASVQMAYYEYFIGPQGTSYSGGPSWSFAGTVTGIYAGAGGGADPSHTVNFTLPARPPKPPNPPNAPSVDSITGTGARVSWWNIPEANGAGVDMYRTHMGNRADFAPGSYYAIDTTGAPGVHRTDLTPGTRYYAMVIAHNAAGWSGWSGLTSFTTLDYPSQPGMPYVVQGTVLPDSVQVNFTGSASNGGSAIDYYQVELINSAYTAVLQTKNVAGGPVSFTGLTPGTLYFVRVRAHNGVGFSPLSADLSFTTLSGAKVVVNGSWANAIARVNVNGGWNLAKVWKNVNGTWVL